MNTLTIIGQILGFVAMALIVWSFQFKDYKKLFLLQVGSCFFFVLHYLFLGLGGDPAAYSGMAQNFVGLLFRAVLLLGEKHKKICVGSLWTRDSNVIRLCQLIAVSPSWLLFNVFTFSIPGILLESFNIISIIIYYIRMRIRGKSESGKGVDA